MENIMNKVAVLGLGYVGLSLALAIQRSNKYQVVGFDVSTNRVGKIQEKRGQIEDGSVKKDIQELNLDVSSDPQSISNSDYYLICVPTPIDTYFKPDLSALRSALSLVGSHLKSGDVVVIESTVNPGVCEEVVIPLLEKTSGLVVGRDFELAHCPERINPGDSKWNIYNIPRNVGAVTQRGVRKVADFYRSFLDISVYEMANLKEVEATKIVENTFRDINIAYVNELAVSFDLLGINLLNVIEGASNKPFGFMAHYPGCGVGGHCIPVDPYYLIDRAKESNFEHSFLSMARSVNNSMPEYAVERLIMGLNKIGRSIKGTKIGLLGLSYKADVGDLRESPALKIKKILEERYEASLGVYDPFFPDKSTHLDLTSLLAYSEVVVLTVGHTEFTDSPLDLWENVQVIVDGRNCLNRQSLETAGKVYLGIGQ